MPRAEQSTTGLAVETVTPTRVELDGGYKVGAEVPEDSLAPHSATSPGFEYQKLTDDASEVVTGQTEMADIVTGQTEVADIVPAEVEPPVPQDAIEQATSGEKAPLLRHDSNRYHFPQPHGHHHQVYQLKQEQHSLGLEEAEPELFLDFAHFVEGSIPEHSTRGGVDRWTDFKWMDEMAERQQQDDGYALFSPLPEEGVLPEHQVRGFGGFEQELSVEEQEEEQGLLEQMEEGEDVPLRHANRTVPLKAKVSTALRAVGKDVTNTFADMRQQFTVAVEHVVTDVGRRMSLDEQSEHNAAQRCLQEGKMAEYHEHQTFANVCAALSAACRQAVTHEAHAPNLVHPRPPLLSATQQNEALEHNLETSIPSSHANEAFDVSLSRQTHELDRDEDIAESSNASQAHGISEIPLGGAAEEEVRATEPLGEQVRHAADEIYQQLEQAAEDSVAELEHIMDVAEARQHVRALQYLACGNEISYHFREAASHAAAALSTLLHRAHEHAVPMSSSNGLATQNADTNIVATSNVNLDANVEARVSGSPASAAIPVYPPTQTPAPSPASGYNSGDIPVTF